MAGIYIHIPFCRQACSYCNFHFSTSQKHKPAMMQALQKEISLTSGFIQEESVETIYIGGGTPSLLSVQELADLFLALRKKFIIAPQAEITLETNPDDITPALLEAWKEQGINRLSVGLQSLNEDELKWMNRAHNAAQSLQCLNDIAAAGITNFSVDLIYGSPLQSDEDLIRNFWLVADRNIPHISCYALTVEPKTALNKLIELHKSPAVDADKQAAQFSLLLELMKQAGYEQYEISNFSKPGFRSKHNSSYWQGKPYFGFGPSAHSFDGNNRRRWNVANNNLYIQSLAKEIVPYEEEILTADQKLNEYVMTALRTSEGIDIARLRADFDPAHADRISREAQKYFTGNKLILNGNFIQLTEEGKFLADGIAADLFATS